MEISGSLRFFAFRLADGDDQHFLVAINTSKKHLRKMNGSFEPFSFAGAYALN